MCRTSCLWLLFSSELLRPDLDLFITYVPTQYPSQDIYQHLCEFELFAAGLTDSTAQNVKTVFFTFDLTLVLQVTFILKR